MTNIPASWFLREVLKIEPYPWQVEALKAVAMGKHRLGGRHVAIVAPNGSGKTSNCIAPAILYFLTIFPRGQVPVTSSSWMQVERQLFPALRRYADNDFFDGWIFNKTEVRTPVGGFAVGFSTDQPGRAEGWHPKISPDVDPVLYVLDEAKSIPDGVFSAVSRCTLYHALIASSPGADSGKFYECFHKNSPSYYKINVSYEDCPHIERTDPGKAERIKREYGEESAFYRSSILGEFTDLDGQSVISRKSLRELIDNPPDFLDTGRRCAGWDFAAGGDENVFALGNGNRFSVAAHWRDGDTVSARGRFRQLAAGLLVPADAVWADGDGLGLPMIDDFANEGFPVNSYRGGAAAEQCDAFVNLRAQAWRALARAIEEREVVLDIDDETFEQLVGPRLEMDARGRIKVESKEDMSKRGLRSPDRADALVMAYYASTRTRAAEVLSGIYFQRRVQRKERRLF